MDSLYPRFCSGCAAADAMTGVVLKLTRYGRAQMANCGHCHVHLFQRGTQNGNRAKEERESRIIDGWMDG